MKFLKRLMSYFQKGNNSKRLIKNIRFLNLKG
uniref:Uncharacterized protein n=1 Tax=Siphoviridae sp. ctt5z12 TaxID=2823604 RepID=A0A8S5LBS0_9CAUD|nr:MAG TPA: hypothetical protein [Siphoviridae sp. ctt5z12]